MVESIATTIFDLCCQIMAFGAHVLGLTYKEFCVLGNIYLQTLVLVLSTLPIVYVAWRRFNDERTMIHLFVLLLSILYFVAFLIAFIIICLHYAMPLEEAFNLCVKELVAFGKWFYNVGYIGANLMIFIIGWILVFVFNVFVYKTIKNVTNEKVHS